MRWGRPKANVRKKKKIIIVPPALPHLLDDSHITKPIDVMVLHILYWHFVSTVGSTSNLNTNILLSDPFPPPQPLKLQTASPRLVEVQHWTTAGKNVPYFPSLFSDSFKVNYTSPDNSTAIVV